MEFMKRKGIPSMYTVLFREESQAPSTLTKPELIKINTGVPSPAPFGSPDDQYNPPAARRESLRSRVSQSRILKFTPQDCYRKFTFRRDRKWCRVVVEE